MATMVLSAAGAAVGGAIGGSIAGLSTAAAGRALGSYVGKAIDQSIMGLGAEAREVGKVDRFRLTNAGSGASIAQLYGRLRVAGQVIWASDFVESSTSSGGGGGKGVGGGRGGPETITYSYAVSLAVAVCEGEVTRVGRIWADGEEIAPDTLNMRVYKGSADQLPDPLIEAIEGQGAVPAYRGTAYVVMDNFDLEPFGNRVPQFSFEVVRPEQPSHPDAPEELARAVQAVALMPGTGEYALATTAVNYFDGSTSRWTANVNTPAAKPDFVQSLEVLQDELPNCQAASLIVCWFGGDLRAAHCRIAPKVEQQDADGENMPWTVSGAARDDVALIEQVDGRPIYGGTPADAAVIESIRAMNANGQAVMFYPFILMDQLDSNTLTNPYTGEAGQPPLPWRGRITSSLAPGMEGSPDGTGAMNAEVAAFVGTATAAHFTIEDGEVVYSGPDEWTFSRFILHYAALCRAAGGVDSFCIGSELRGLTWLRGANHTFPFVDALLALIPQVRSLLGSEVKLGYAADWSEYFGYQPPDGNVYFHLDPVWAHPEIDFIGIDNYMPLSDWRDGSDHVDAQTWDDIYNLDYLRSNVEGGEGYDWYYHSIDAQAAQIRTPITDGAHDEPWVYRYKDLRNWWLHPHHNRIDGTRAVHPTDWLPQSKPFWFTEFGCAAIDKGTNQPNKFLDPKSSESRLPKYSNGARDDLIQKQYLRAMHTHWAQTNLTSVEYGGDMVDMSRAFVWAWDTRPYPFFPNLSDLWSDGANYPRGHWINGRTGNRTLANVISEMCDRAGLTAYSTQGLYGSVRGYLVADVTDARSAIQSLILAHGFDAVDRDGLLRFVPRDGQIARAVDPAWLAISDDLDGVVEQSRLPEAEMSGRVRIGFVVADADFEISTEEAVLPDEATHAVAGSEVDMSLTRSEGRQIAERWLAEARIARESVRLALPPSQSDLGAGDVLQLPGDGTEGPAQYRIDQVEVGPMQIVDAVRIEPETYIAAQIDDTPPRVRPYVPPMPVQTLFLDLPLLSGDEVPHAPHIAVASDPWPGSVAVYSAPEDSGYALNTVLGARATMGLTQTALPAARPGLWDRGPGLEVKLIGGTLSSISDTALLSGGNLMAIGDGSPGNWELFQFADAELIAERTYRLSRRLRGQQGTDAVMPAVWPAGSWAVLVNGALSQIDLRASLRHVAQHYRIGPAGRSYDDPSYVYRTEAFDGIGLRPYAPVHLARRTDQGAHHFTWIRRTRIDGDTWLGDEVPLGEDREAYRVTVYRGADVLRSAQVSTPSWIYAAAEQAADGPYTHVTVAQISDRFGAGPAASLAA
ncbi:MAG: glycoside hydrolase/phage tail family protein [Pseudomonadota bacterium]